MIFKNLKFLKKKFVNYKINYNKNVKNLMIFSKIAKISNLITKIKSKNYNKILIKKIMNLMIFCRNTKDLKALIKNKIKIKINQLYKMMFIRINKNQKIII